MTPKQPAATPRTPASKAGSTRNQGTRKGRRMAPPEVIVDEMVRQERAFQLKIGGLTFQQIADSEHPTDPARKLYASPSAARDAWRTAAARHAGVQQTAEMREEWRLRNEAIIRTLMPTCLDRKNKDQHWAIDRYTRLFDVTARMLGLYQDKLQILPGETDLEKALRELSAEVAARAGDAPVPEEEPAVEPAAGVEF